MNAVASLFSNAKANASREDIAKGLIWMVLQAIGSATILSSLESGIKDFVLIGNLTLMPQCREVYPAWRNSTECASTSRNTPSSALPSVPP